MKLIVNNNLIDLSQVNVIKEEDENSTSFHYGEDESNFICLNLPIKNIINRLDSLGVKLIKDDNEEYIVQDNIIALEDQGDGDYLVIFKNGTTGTYCLKEELKKLFPTVENIVNEVLEEEEETEVNTTAYASGDSLDRDHSSTGPKIVIALVLIIGAILAYKFLI